MLRQISQVLALAGLMLGASFVPVAAAESGTGSFVAKVELKALKNQKTGRTPQLPFSGNFAHSGGKFRMELVNDLTTESQIIILDPSAKKAWMLFPDTLNGITADLAQFDKKGLATKAQSLMGGDFSKVPQDWSKPTSKQTTLNGAKVTELTYMLKKAEGNGGSVTLWHKADKSPVKVVFDSAALKLTVDFNNIVSAANVPAGQFSPGKNYKLRTLGKGEAPPLPGGLPEGMF